MPEEISFTTYIKRHFYHELFDAVKAYCPKSEGEMTGMTIKATHVKNSPNMELSFDVIVISLFQSVESSDEQCFQVSCSGNLEWQLDDFKVEAIQEVSGETRHAMPLSDALVPYIRRDQFDEVAESLMRQVYPRALWKNQVVNPRKLVEKLGLKLDFKCLSKDGSIFGETIFSDSQVAIYDETLDKFNEQEINGGTILVDPKLYLSRNTGAVNNTIIHECVHWLLHRKAAALERLFNPKVRLLRTELSIENKSTIDWIEWQAKALTPRIQMPLTSFRRKVDELRKIYLYLNGRRANRIDEMEYLIDELSNFYKVSKMAAKIRLLDIGVEDARGIYKYLDGRPIPSYVFEQGTLSPTQTFSISLKDAVRQSAENPNLRAKLETGKYLFVESHFCLNAPQYMKINRFGKMELTRYARLHMEECCLIFELVIKERQHTECFDEVLYRDVNSDITFEAHFASESRTSKEILINKRLIELQQLAMSLPASFSGTVTTLIKWSELTLEQVIEKSLLSESTLLRMRTDENYNTSIEAIVQFSIGLHLPPEISSILFSHSTKRLGNSELHFMYRFLLNCCYTSSIYECNDILEMQDFKRLGKEL